MASSVRIDASNYPSKENGTSGRNLSGSKQHQQQLNQNKQLQQQFLRLNARQQLIEERIQQSLQENYSKKSPIQHKDDSIVSSSKIVRSSIPLASELFTDSDETEREDADPLTCGDSDFEPVDQSLFKPLHQGGCQFDFDPEAQTMNLLDSTSPFHSSLERKLESEHGQFKDSIQNNFDHRNSNDASQQSRGTFQSKFARIQQDSFKYSQQKDETNFYQQNQTRTFAKGQLHSTRQGRAQQNSVNWVELGGEQPNNRWDSDDETKFYISTSQNCWSEDREQQEMKKKSSEKNVDYLIDYNSKEEIDLEIGLKNKHIKAYNVSQVPDQNVQEIKWTSQSSLRLVGMEPQNVGKVPDQNVQEIKWTSQSSLRLAGMAGMISNKNKQVVEEEKAHSMSPRMKQLRQQCGQKQQLDVSFQKESRDHKEQKKKSSRQQQCPTFLLQGPLAQLMENRSYFKNQEQPNVAQTKQANFDQLKIWFQSLSIQNRINSLTTTYPAFVSSVITAMTRYFRHQGPLCLFSIKKVEKQSEDGDKQKRKPNPMLDADQFIFEYQLNQDRAYSPYQFQGSIRELHTSFLKLLRVSCNKADFDTITVSADMVKSADQFFQFIEQITQGQAFQNPLQFCCRIGNNSKPVMEGPKMIDRREQNYLAVWIVAVLEETLWAHFNYSNQINFASGVRKNEINQLFELRSENLQNQQDLADRWVQLGQPGQDALIQALKHKAQEESQFKYIQKYEELERSNPVTLYPYNNQQQSRYGYYHYQEIPLHSDDIGHMLDSFQQDPDRLQRFYSSDNDLKDILDYVTCDYFSALEKIKFLTEIPLTEINQKNYIRKHVLCKELHQLIQENLRQSIQDSLINDLLNEKRLDVGGQDEKKKKKRKNDQKKKEKQTFNNVKKETTDDRPLATDDNITNSSLPLVKINTSEISKKAPKLESSQQPDITKKEKQQKKKNTVQKFSIESHVKSLIEQTLIDQVFEQVQIREELQKRLETQKLQEEQKLKQLSIEKTKRKRNKKKKQDPEEIVNNFMRKLHGAEKESKDKINSKQGLKQQLKDSDQQKKVENKSKVTSQNQSQRQATDLTKSEFQEVQEPIQQQVKVIQSTVPIFELVERSLEFSLVSESLEKSQEQIDLSSEKSDKKTESNRGLTTTSSSFTPINQNTFGASFFAPNQDQMIHSQTNAVFQQNISSQIRDFDLSGNKDNVYSTQDQRYNQTLNRCNNGDDQQIRVDAPCFEPWSHAYQIQHLGIEFKGIVEDEFFLKFDQEIFMETQHTQLQIQMCDEERAFIVNKIQEIANRAFLGNKPIIKVFGSLMTGLALITSDLDLVVTGLTICDRLTMTDYLHCLADQLRKWDQILELKTIETASIPVIKAKLNLSKISLEMGKQLKSTQSILPIDITFDDSLNDQQTNTYQGLPTPLLNLISSEFGLIDFTGPQQVRTHLGLANCNLLKDYVSNYPCLREVAIMIKKFLVVNELNVAYQGGLGSYSAVLLITAYMNNFQLYQSPNLTPSRLLMGFLDFYANSFDPRFYGVNPANGKSFYQLPFVNQHTFVIIDPLNPSNNTSRNCFRTSEILDQFRAAYSRLNGFIEKQVMQLQDSASKIEAKVDVLSGVNSLKKNQYSTNPMQKQAHEKQYLQGQAVGSNGVRFNISQSFGQQNFVSEFLAAKITDQDPRL